MLYLKHIFLHFFSKIQSFLGFPYFCISKHDKNYISRLLSLDPTFDYLQHLERVIMTIVYHFLTSAFAYCARLRRHWTNIVRNTRPPGRQPISPRRLRYHPQYHTHRRFPSNTQLQPTTESSTHIEVFEILAAGRLAWSWIQAGFASLTTWTRIRVNATTILFPSQSFTNFNSIRL